MLLFGIFCIIVTCLVCPPLIIAYLSPFIIMIGAILFGALRNKIKYGYWEPWSHREELEKKGIIY